MRKITKIRRSVKAVSPVISVLLMIAIAVSAALVAFAWVSGYMDFTTAKIGKQIQVQSVATDVAYVQNTGDSNVLLVDLYVNGELDPNPDFSPEEIGPSETSTVTPSIKWEDDPRVTIKIVTSDGLSTEHQKTFTTATGTGGTTTPPPTVAQISSTTTGFSGVQAGDLLVVIANTRTGDYTTGELTASADEGFGNAVEVASFYTGSGDRRAVALFVKTATGTESGDVSVTWSVSGSHSDYATCYQIFRTNVGEATTWTVRDSGSNNGISGESTSLSPVPSISLSGGSTANVLTIGAIGGRVGPDSATFSNLPLGLYNFNRGGAYSSTAYNYGLPVTTTNVDWTGDFRVSGLLAQIEVK
ncbi:MAG: hypothetical protein IAX21_00365 [Candidatus Bathyarchaeota archaeon]|nr:MAG: hypothetical protein IAX21_00365 [Candidatus Bathyarchaeota archaeon]